jgi:hypothetical protein
MRPIREFWAKLRGREQIVATGALVVVAGWILGLVTGYGIGVGTMPLVGAVAILGIYWLKYAPSQTVNWPAPIPAIVLGISAIVAILAVVNLLQWMTLAGALAGLFGAVVLALIVIAIGAGLMAYGAWQEYQASKPAG